MAEDTIRLPQRIRLANNFSDLDYFYGPYSSLEEANKEIIASLRSAGRTVGIIDGISKEVTEYWYQPISAEDDTLTLVKKNSGSGGDIDSISKDDITKLFEDDTE